MNEDVDELGPVDSLVIEFPADRTNFQGRWQTSSLRWSRAARSACLICCSSKNLDGSVEGFESHEFEDSELVWENVWAAPLGAAVRRSGGQLVAGGRIPIHALAAAIEADEPVTAERV